MRNEPQIHAGVSELLLDPAKTDDHGSVVPLTAACEVVSRPFFIEVALRQSLVVVL